MKFQKRKTKLLMCALRIFTSPGKSLEERRGFFSHQSHIFFGLHHFQKRKIRGSKAQSGRVTMEKFTSK